MLLPMPIPMLIPMPMLMLMPMLMPLPMPMPELLYYIILYFTILYCAILYYAQPHCKVSLFMCRQPAERVASGLWHLKNKR